MPVIRSYIVTITVTLIRVIVTLTYLAQLSLSPGHKTLLSSLSSISCPNKTMLSPEKHTHPSLCSHPWALPYCWSHYYFSIVLVYDGRGNSHPCFWRPQLLHVAPRWVCTGRDTWTTSQQQLRSQRGWLVQGSSQCWAVLFFLARPREKSRVRYNTEASPVDHIQTQSALE